jgi:hypothetical protein
MYIISYLVSSEYTRLISQNLTFLPKNFIRFSDTSATFLDILKQKFRENSTLVLVLVDVLQGRLTNIWPMSCPLFPLVEGNGVGNCMPIPTSVQGLVMVRMYTLLPARVLHNERCEQILAFSSSFCSPSSGRSDFKLFYLGNQKSI